MRHAFRQKNHFLSFFERFTENNLNFFYVNHLFHPLECWKTQKTASNLFSYFLCTEPKFKITQIPSLKKPSLPLVNHFFIHVMFLKSVCDDDGDDEWNVLLIIYCLLILCIHDDVRHSVKECK